jgi:RNA polymerase sigma factor (sigma-70 family)
MAAVEDAGRGARSVAATTHDLYRQYGKQIYAYCLHQLRSREEAEDAVQTTFLNAFRGLQRGTTTQFEQAWLYKIAQNVCIARRSSSGRRLRLEAPDDFELLQEVVPSNSASGDTLELMGLDAALEKMPENQRRAILLREWQGLSYREIASQLGLSQGAVEMLIFRARRTLATALEEPKAEKRSVRRAKAGFSVGSLVAALKPLVSGGAALKMAAVAVSAAVVGTSTAHTVVRQAKPVRAMRPAASRVVAHAASVAVRTPVRAHLQLASYIRPARKATTRPATFRRTTPTRAAAAPVVEPAKAPAEPEPVEAPAGNAPSVEIAPPASSASTADAPSAAAPAVAVDSPTTPTGKGGGHQGGRWTYSAAPTPDGDTTSTPTATTITTTTTTPPADPQSSEADAGDSATQTIADPPGNGNGNGNAYGHGDHGNGKSH